MAANWMRSLEELTLRTDLRPLSMLRWSEVLSPMGLFHDTARWCPDCYREHRSAESQIYEPLLWALRPVHGCRRHKRTLVSRCDHCAKTPRRWLSIPGLCSHCQQFLGDERDGVKDKCVELYDRSSQDWILNNLGELLASNIPPPRRKLTEALQSLCERFTSGNRCKFVLLYADKSKSTANQWWTHGRIGIDALLTLSRRTQCSVIELLTAEFKPVIKQLDLLSIEHSEGPAKPKRRPPRTYDKNKLEAALQLVLQEEHPPSSFAKVAERLQVNNRHLRKMFPELSRSVAARCKQEREAIGAARIQSAGEDIQWAAHQLLRQGIYPSRRSVVLFMKANGKVPRHDILNRVLNRIGGEEAQVDTMKVFYRRIRKHLVSVSLWKQ